MRWLLVAGVLLVPLAFGPDVHLAKRLVVWAVAVPAVVLWAGRALAQRSREQTLRPGVTLPVVAFAGVLAWSTAHAVSVPVALWGSIYRHEGLLVWLAYLVVALLTAHEVRNDARLQRRWMAALVVGAMLSAGYAMLQYTGQDPIWRYRALLRPFGFQSHAVYLAMHLTMAAPVALALAVELRSVPGRLVGLLPVLLLYLGVLMTASRVGWVGFWLAAGLWGLAVWPGLRRTDRRWLVGTGAALTLLTVVYLMPWGPFARTFDEATLERVQAAGALRDPSDVKPLAARMIGTLAAEGGLSVRMMIWRAALHDWLQRPWLGQGLDTFRHYPTGWRPGEAFYDRAHNWVLDLGVATGVLGVVGFGWTLVALLGPAVRQALARREPALAALAAGPIAWLFQVQVEPSVIGTNFVLWALLGCGYAVATSGPWHADREGRQARQRVRHGWSITTRASPTVFEAANCLRPI
ncbi:MAG: O-antigen ligase family protein [Armatimonadota bacterium]|nr:O-antigen ligase family protein [Armatimonadota bacterium]